MPGADELFRRDRAGVRDGSRAQDEAAGASGRVKHDEKMTVYVTAAELLAVEQARLQLRAARVAPSTADDSSAQLWPWRWPTWTSAAPTVTSLVD